MYPIPEARKQLLRTQNPIEMQIRFRAAPGTASVELSLVRLCPVVRYEVRAKSVEDGVWPVAWRLSRLGTHMYLYIAAASVAMEMGLLGFGFFWAKGGFFSVG
jgi:hypothetical protein